MPKYRYVGLWVDEEYYYSLYQSAPITEIVSGRPPDLIVADLLVNHARSWTLHLQHQQDRLREERERDPTAF